MKAVISANAKIVTFFTRSHYWGGQLLEVAKKTGIEKRLPTHTDTRWYTLILQAMAIREYK